MHKKFLIIKDNCLICTVHVDKGIRVFSLEGKLLDYPTSRTVHIGNNVHIVDYYGSYLSHSFEPNCKIQGLDVIAEKDIIPGDILTYNFNTTEINMAYPFVHEGILVKGIY